MLKLNGVLPPLTTPFDHEGNLYRTKVAHNVSRLNAVALIGYVVGGSSGESPLLSTNERIQLFEWVKEAAADGKALIAGTATESVRETVCIVNRAAEIGYHAALVLGPRYFRNLMHRPETQALFYRAVADQARIPILVYNFPNVTGYDIPVDTLATLSEHPNIAGMKDSSGNVEKLGATVKAVKAGFQVLSGSGTTFWPALQAGAAGGILAFADCAPYACVTIWEAFRTRDYEAAEDWQNRILLAAKLVTATYGIPGLKHAMDLNGYYGGPPRLPLIPASAEARADIEQALQGIKS
ncbi:MAG: dihydrodipicolinate synthase family protein [Bryobacteraceae bacterium]